MTAASRIRCIRVAAVVATVVLLSGCVGLGGGKRGSIAIYEPSVRVEPRAEWPQVGWQLAVAKPVANRVLDSARVAVRPEPGVVQSYKGAAWSDSAPEMLQTLVVHAFEDSGHIVAVGRQASGLRADYLLLLDLRAFESVYEGGSPQATVTLHAKLVHAPTNRVLAGRTFHAAEPAADTQVPAVIGAFERALGELLPELIGWTLATGDANGHALR